MKPSLTLPLLVFVIISSSCVNHSTETLAKPAVSWEKALKQPFSDGTSSITRDSISITCCKEINLSLEEGKDYDEEFGIQLIEVTKNSATIYSTDHNRKAKAKVGKNFSKRMYGRLGLYLIEVSPDTSSAKLERTYSMPGSYFLKMTGKKRP